MLLLVSGMHFTMSAHICGGQVSAVVWSFGGEKASCDMHDSTFPNGTTIIDTDCCDNTDITVSTDNNYSPSVNPQLPELTTSSFSFNFLIPAIPSISSIKESSKKHFIFPEKDLLAGGMSIPDLCIFRI